MIISKKVLTIQLIMISRLKAQKPLKNQRKICNKKILTRKKIQAKIKKFKNPQDQLSGLLTLKFKIHKDYYNSQFNLKDIQKTLNQSTSSPKSRNKSKLKKHKRKEVKMEILMNQQAFLKKKVSLLMISKMRQI